MKQEARSKKQEKFPIIILHGWRKVGNDYAALQKILEKSGFHVYAPDLPGFGSQKLTKPIMVLDDYVKFVSNFIQVHKLTNVILLGHSFGGRVAAKFSAKYPEVVEKLIITGSPLIRRKLSLKRRIVSLVAKLGKAGLAVFPKNITNLSRKVLYKSIGEWDYYKSGELRETFVNIINEDVSPVLPKIKTPALLLWGANETFVPVADGREIAKSIPNAKFVLIKNAGHKLPYENPQEFARAVLDFLS